MRFLVFQIPIFLFFFALAIPAPLSANISAECDITNSRSGSGQAFLIANPENTYQRELNRLLRLEIENLNRAVGEVEKKRMQLVRLRKDKTNLQVIPLEQANGVLRNGRKINYLAKVHLLYQKNRLHCLMLESITRPVYEPDEWTHKMIRLRFPGIESLELASRRHNMNLLQDFKNVDPNHQLQLLRLLVRNLKTALYSMDMQIAAFYEQRNKKNQWQINM